MKKSSKVLLSPTRRWFIIIFLILLVFYAGYLVWPKSQTNEVFLAAPPTIEYGNTTVAGRLQKDTPIGISGNYILVLADGSPVLLTSKGLDPFVGKTVFVSGILLPKINPNLMMTMDVSSIREK